jgi:signal transduction histidine kinase/CheY-like chemotaxis protein/PAS domain-containing protein
MPADGGSRLEDLRLVIVDSPDVAAALIGSLDIADVGTWMWVEAEHALYVSPRVLDILGLTAGPQVDLIGQFRQGVHPGDKPAVFRLLGRQAPAGPFELRYRFTPPQGPLRWIEDRGRVERRDNGQLIRQGGAMREVTREVGREHERREADARLEALINAMPFAVWGRSGPALAVTHQNAVAMEQWGDLRGSALDDAPPDVRGVWQAQTAEVMTGQIVRTRHAQFLGGEKRIIEEIVAPVVVQDRVTGVVGVGLDVTEEERIRTFEGLLAEIASDCASRAADRLDAALTDALAKLGRFFGARLCVLCEVSPDRQVRLLHWWIDPITGRDRPRAMQFDCNPVRTLIDRLAANKPVVVRSLDELPGGSREREWLMAHQVQSAVIVPAQHVDAPLTVLGFAGGPDERIDWPVDTPALARLASALLSSVLARIRVEADQRAIERRIQEAQRLESLGVLAGGIAHDFNNLLTAILGHTSLLRLEKGVSDVARASLDEIEDAATRAAELCRQMLGYAGRGRFALQLLDLNELIRGTRELLSVTIPKRARLDFVLAPELPAVLADEPQIRQLLANLLINAAEALPDGAGTVTIRTGCGWRTANELSRTAFSPQLSDGDYVSVSVTDTGAGMTPETLARIFDPFFSTKFTGRGLGLAAVIGITRAHKGALRVETRKGSGSTFELLLPAQQRPAVTLPTAGAAGAPSDLAHWRSSGTVLVVDDQLGVRNLTRSVLERAGLTVILADSGQQGVDVFRELTGEIRLVMIDLTMPGLDGRETLAAMRRINAGVSAILMSGYSPEDLVRSRDYLFLQKPFTPDALRAKVRQALHE